ncbi:hypothetical protein K8R33_01975 [archaeon]|nr:hypothetical protein [archaeon]
MGLFEEYQATQRFNEIVSGVNDFMTFYHKGLFSRGVALHYFGLTLGPHVQFYCEEDDGLSFRVHNLQFGEDAPYWNLAVQRGKDIEFNGFANRIFSGRMRGILSVPEEGKRLGVCVDSGKVDVVRTQEQLDEAMNLLVAPILNYIYFLGSRVNSTLEGAMKK